MTTRTSQVGIRNTLSRMVRPLLPFARLDFQGSSVPHLPLPSPRNFPRVRSSRCPSPSGPIRPPKSPSPRGTKPVPPAHTQPRRPHGSLLENGALRKGRRREAGPPRVGTFAGVRAYKERNGGIRDRGAVALPGAERDDRNVGDVEAQ